MRNVEHAGAQPSAAQCFPELGHMVSRLTAIHVVGPRFELLPGMHSIDPWCATRDERGPMGTDKHARQPLFPGPGRCSKDR